MFERARSNHCTGRDVNAHARAGLCCQHGETVAARIEISIVLAILIAVPMATRCRLNPHRPAGGKS